MWVLEHTKNCRKNRIYIKIFCLVPISLFCKSRACYIFNLKIILLYINSTKALIRCVKIWTISCVSQLWCLVWCNYIFIHCVSKVKVYLITLLCDEWASFLYDFDCSALFTSYRDLKPFLVPSDVLYLFFQVNYQPLNYICKIALSINLELKLLLFLMKLITIELEVAYCTLDQVNIFVEMLVPIFFLMH